MKNTTTRALPILAIALAALLAAPALAQSQADLHRFLAEADATLVTCTDAVDDVAANDSTLFAHVCFRPSSYDPRGAIDLSARLAGYRAAQPWTDDGEGALFRVWASPDFDYALSIVMFVDADYAIAFSTQ